ncbi:hypothetical protein [Alteribacter populi]|uniref:hypothetical protein n=1 Tax=Alteribacter populi TaxID=2011011 RepID=UPI000BBB0D1B|nr:hypothetical protein [Alteribacter populi]
MALKKWLSFTFVLTAFFLTPVASTFAAEGGNGEEEGVSLITQGPLVIMGVATIIVMIYYAFRD